MPEKLSLIEMIINTQLLLEWEEAPLAGLCSSQKANIYLFSCHKIETEQPFFCCSQLQYSLTHKPQQMHGSDTRNLPANGHYKDGLGPLTDLVKKIWMILSIYYLLTIQPNDSIHSIHCRTGNYRHQKIFWQSTQQRKLRTQFFLQQKIRSLKSIILEQPKLLMSREETREILRDRRPTMTPSFITVTV